MIKLLLALLLLTLAGVVFQLIALSGTATMENIALYAVILACGAIIGNQTSQAMGWGKGKRRVKR